MSAVYTNNVSAAPARQQQTRSAPTEPERDPEQLDDDDEPPVKPIEPGEERPYNLNNRDRHLLVLGLMSLMRKHAELNSTAGEIIVKMDAVDIFNSMVAEMEQYTQKAVAASSKSDALDFEEAAGIKTRERPAGWKWRGTTQG